MDYDGIASALLAEVGLTFDDVYDMGRPWQRYDPLNDLLYSVARPAYQGVCHPISQHNKHSRQRHLIGISGPVDCERMVLILAHECAHAHLKFHFGTSRPDYVAEYEAEIYSFRAFERHVGRPPHDYFVANGKKYVRKHCWARERANNLLDFRRWSWKILDWCGYIPYRGMEEILQSNAFTGANHSEVARMIWPHA